MAGRGFDRDVVGAAIALDVELLHLEGLGPVSVGLATVAAEANVNAIRICLLIPTSSCDVVGVILHRPLIRLVNPAFILDPLH